MKYVQLFSRPGTFYVVSDKFQKVLLLDIEGPEFQVERSDIRPPRMKGFRIASMSGDGDRSGGAIAC